MATEAAQFDLTTAFLDVPKTLCYGLVRGAGNVVMLQELADKSRVAFIMLGEGPWDSILRLWINSNAVTLPSVNVHFHPGTDGVIGSGMSAVSTGGDQLVDSFFTLLPGGLDPITFNRFAWIAVKVAPDPGAPSADLTVRGDYQTMQVRQFDSLGNVTSFAWTQNWAWIICDYLIRKFILREGKVNQPLLAAETARFDWPSFAAAATYYDVNIGGGVKRFSDGGLVFLNDGSTADKVLEQMLLMCRSYLLDRNGKIGLYPDQPRASVFTFTSDNVVPNTFKAYKNNLRSATNRINPAFRDYSLASGSSDDATRFAIATSPVLDHEAHQRTVGVRGPGLSPIPKVTELALDFGVNTPERVYRLGRFILLRQLGDDVDPNLPYNAPFTAEWTAYEDSSIAEAGDFTTIHRSISEEFGGKQFEILEALEKGDGTREITGLEVVASAFIDAAPAQQQLQAPDPGTGLVPPTVVDGSGVLTVPLDKTSDVPPRFARTAAHSTYRPLSNPLTAHDAGSNVTINIAAFTNRVAGTDVSVNLGSITALSYGTRYFIYYDDPNLAGGTVTFNATTTKETAINNVGRFCIGSITTPVAGAADSTGNNDGGTAAQVGFLQICIPSAAAAVGAGIVSGGTAAAFDGDFTTSTVFTENTGTGGAASTLDYLTFEKPVFPPTSITLRVTNQGSVVNTGGVTGDAQLQYSINGGSTYNLIWQIHGAGTRAKQTDSISIPAGVDIKNQLRVRMQVQATGTGGTFTASISNFETWCEVSS